MKKTFSFIAFVATLLLSNVAFAQEPTAITPTKNVTLNVKLLPVISLEIADGVEVINLVYKTADDYKDGAVNERKGHLKVISMGAYAIKAKAESDLVNPKGTIGAGDITLTVGTGTAKALNTTGIDLVSSDIATLPTGTLYDITYRGKGNNEFVTKYISGENPTIYTTQVTYTVEAI